MEIDFCSYIGKKIEKKFKWTIVSYTRPFFKVVSGEVVETLRLSDLRMKLGNIPDTRCVNLVGRTFSKLYDGIVTSYKNGFFEVQYEDEDTETLSIDELQSLLQSASKKRNRTDSLSSPSKKRPRMSESQQDPPVPPPWAVQEREEGVQFGGHRIKSFNIEVKSAERNFMDVYFGRERFIETVFEMPGRSKAAFDTPAKITTEFNGMMYELVHVKEDQAPSSVNPGVNVRKQTCRYLRVSGGTGQPPLSIQDRLNQVADFGSLSTVEKLASRLEILQSPCTPKYPPYHGFKAADFSVLEDAATAPKAADGEYLNDGCGFISDAMLTQLLGGSNPDKQIAVQVRIFSPKLGVFKGMLMRKRGIDKILLPISMRKVPRSAINSEDWACVIVRAAFPSRSCVQMGRVVNDRAPNNSFSPTKLKKMVPNLWRSLGVREIDIENHKAEKYPKHGFLIGVADPTEHFPRGHVFLTGFPNAPPVVFVTRSPCVLPEHGRMLPVLKQKPAEMSTAEWKWLLTLPFGAIVYSTAPAPQPLAATVADGDLDGDLYLVLWNTTLLKQIRQRPLVAEEVVPRQGRSHDAPVQRSTWFRAAQEELIRPERLANMALVGWLYTQMEKIHEVSPKFMDDEDAVAYAKAYKQALDYPKRGGQIYLPEHLLAKVPEYFLQAFDV